MAALAPVQESQPAGESQVIPIHEIPGWESFAREAWAKDWYARVAPDGYTYLHSPDRIPTPSTSGWSDIPPAPPIDPAIGLAITERVVVDHLVPAVTELISDDPYLDAIDEDELFEALVEVLNELASEEK